MTETRSDILIIQKKKQLLEQCLGKTEELLSYLVGQNAEELPEAVSSILAEREGIIRELESVELSINKMIIHSDLDKEKKEINRLIDLLLALDKDAGRLIKAEQERLLADIKIHTNKQKIIPYSSSIPQSGQLMDFKK